MPGIRCPASGYDKGMWDTLDAGYDSTGTTVLGLGLAGTRRNRSSSSLQLLGRDEHAVFVGSMPDDPDLVTT